MIKLKRLAYNSVQVISLMLLSTSLLNTSFGVGWQTNNFGGIQSIHPVSSSSGEYLLQLSLDPSSYDSVGTTHQMYEMACEIGTLFQSVRSLTNDVRIQFVGPGVFNTFGLVPGVNNNSLIIEGVTSNGVPVLRKIPGENSTDALDYFELLSDSTPSRYEGFEPLSLAVNGKNDAVIRSEIYDTAVHNVTVDSLVLDCNYTQMTNLVSTIAIYDGYTNYPVKAAGVTLLGTDFHVNNVTVTNYGSYGDPSTPSTQEVFPIRLLGQDGLSNTENTVSLSSSNKANMLITSCYAEGEVLGGDSAWATVYMAGSLDENYNLIVTNNTAIDIPNGIMMGGATLHFDSSSTAYYADNYGENLAFGYNFDTGGCDYIEIFDNFIQATGGGQIGHGQDWWVYDNEIELIDDDNLNGQDVIFGFKIGVATKRLDFENNIVYKKSGETFGKDVVYAYIKSGYGGAQSTADRHQFIFDVSEPLEDFNPDNLVFEANMNSAVGASYVIFGIQWDGANDILKSTKVYDHGPQYSTYNEFIVFTGDDGYVYEDR